MTKAVFDAIRAAHEMADSYQASQTSISLSAAVWSAAYDTARDNGMGRESAQSLATHLATLVDVVADKQTKPPVRVEFAEQDKGS